MGEAALLAANVSAALHSPLVAQSVQPARASHLAPIVALAAAFALVVIGSIPSPASLGAGVAAGRIGGSSEARDGVGALVRTDDARAGGSRRTDDHARADADRGGGAGGRGLDSGAEAPARVVGGARSMTMNGRMNVMMRSGRGRAVSGLLAALGVTLAAASAEANMKREGDWPANDPKVSLDLEGHASTRCRQAARGRRRLGALVMPSSDYEPVDVSVKDQPADKVLELLLGDDDYKSRGATVRSSASSHYAKARRRRRRTSASRSARRR